MIARNLSDILPVVGFGLDGKQNRCREVVGITRERGHEILRVLKHKVRGRTRFKVITIQADYY